jgi:N-formylglutamate amidohydrolase
MDLFQLTVGEGPLVATAIHNGHFVRPDAARLLSIDEGQRLREEDPYTDFLVAWAPTRLVACSSRYEFDLRRPRDRAVYLKPEDAWGASVWDSPPPEEVVADSLAGYDLCYATLRAALRQIIRRHGAALVIDVHSYNHRRAGPEAPPADEATHPEVNVGTGTVDRGLWGDVVDRFKEALAGATLSGRRLDVRENVKFSGGYFCRWIHHTFPGQACALAVEFKKTFMDEWSGAVDLARLAELRRALEGAAGQTLAALTRGHPHHPVGSDA